MYVYLSNNGWRRDVRERLVVGAGEGDSCGQRAQDGEISHPSGPQWPYLAVLRLGDQHERGICTTSCMLHQCRRVEKSRRGFGEMRVDGAKGVAPIYHLCRCVLHRVSESSN